LNEIGLFSTIKINTLELPNRIMMSPAFSNGAASGGYVTKDVIKHYQARAHSGIGLIMTEHTSVNSYYIHPGNRLQISKDEHIEGMAKLVEAVHGEGIKIALQIAHSIQGVGLKPADLSKETCYEIIEDFVAGARRAAEAGFDAIEFHFAHTYTLADFISRRTNQRTDEFGGDIYGRMRIHLEIVRRVRELLGKDYPLFARIDGEEFVIDGNTLVHSGIFARELEKAGIDCLDVTAGVRFDDAPVKGYSDIRGKPTAEFPDGPNVYLAEAIKKLVTVPVITVGKLGNPEFAESVIREGRADMIALARPLLADAMWVDKVRHKRYDLIKECLYCTECLYERYDAQAPIHCMRYACQNACPANVDVPVYLDLVAQKKYQEAYQTIQLENPLAMICGRVCNHPCEDYCVRVRYDEAIAIKGVKRFATDQVLKAEKKFPVPETAKSNGTKVAVIGSGPSGLTCAFYLQKKGYEVTIFEALPVAGGMLAVGLPAYRLPKALLAQEIQVIREMGVEIKTNTRLGRDISLAGLKEQGYQAVYLAVGTHQNRSLGIPGENLQGVLPGVDFLRDVSLERSPGVQGKQALVIGGGNVAVDVARSLWRLGAAQVHLYCLESREQMPAFKDEVAEALEEGISIHNGWGPQEILGENSRVKEVLFKACASVFDKEGRFAPVYDESKTKYADADIVVTAIGQAVELSFNTSEPKIQALRNSLIKAGSFCATNLPGIFAGGDCVSGPSSVVEAVKYGKEAAASIDSYFGGDGQIIDHKDFVRKLNRPVTEEKLIREKMPSIPREDRKAGFAEVEAGFSETAAENECKRCLRCDVQREYQAVLLGAKRSS